MWQAPAGLVATSWSAAPPAAVLRPDGVAAALEALSRPGAVAVAGGTDLVAAANEGLRPAVLVSLEQLDELRAVAVTADEIRLGALVTHDTGAAHPALRYALPGLCAAWRLLANPRVRFRATLGGNLMARRTRYELAILLRALDARLRFATASGFVEATLEELWDGRIPAPALLHHAAIPRRPGLRLHYRRELRPLLTLAAARHDGGGCVVLATEALRPVALPQEDAALDSLPAAFADHQVSHWYARRAGAALRRRALEALDA